MVVVDDTLARSFLFHFIFCTPPTNTHAPNRPLCGRSHLEDLEEAEVPEGDGRLAVHRQRPPRGGEVQLLHQLCVVCVWVVGCGFGWLVGVCVMVLA